METFEIEIKTEKRLRKNKWTIPFCTLITATALYLLVICCAYFFITGFWWTVIPAGILVHSFFIVTVHDASHKAITGSKWDSLIMNFAAGMMLLPFYAEPFRKYHLVHHSNTNTEIDPLWPELQKKLFHRNRLLYVLCEIVPLAFTLVLILSGEKKRTGKPSVHSPAIRWKYMFFAFVISACVLWVAAPPVWFFAGTLLTVNIVKLLRHWCEHMGDMNGKESNTYWFPLGMGIGNHEAHHRHPHFSWLTMAICLRSHLKDTNPFKAMSSLFFNKKFHHYISHE